MIKTRKSGLCVTDCDESLPTKYVREIISNAIHENVNQLKIENVGGNALCAFSTDIVPYKNVRNRIAIMTDSIKSYDNTKDQFGIISIRIRINDELISYSLKITDQMHSGGIIADIFPA